MNENALQWIQIGKIISLAVFAGLYGFGGVSGKWKRRYIGAAVLTLSICLFSLSSTFSWWYLLCFPLYVSALSVGYGGTDDTKEKIIKRSRYGALCALASLPIVIVNGAWAIFCLHTILCVMTSTVLGVWNPMKSARAEETAIGASIGLLPLFMI